MELAQIPEPIKRQHGGWYYRKEVGELEHNATGMTINLHHIHSIEDLVYNIFEIVRKDRRLVGLQELGQLLCALEYLYMPQEYLAELKYNKQLLTKGEANAKF